MQAMNVVVQGLKTLRLKASRFGIVAPLAAALSLGCSSLASSSDSEASLSSQWACLRTGPDPLPPLTGAPPTLVVYAVPVWDFTHTLSPVPGLQVQACLVGDSDCATPAGQVVGPTTMQVPTGIGSSTVMAPVYAIITQYRADIYLRLTAPNYLQEEYYLGGPLLGPRDGATYMGMPLVVGLPVAPITARDADNLASQISQTRVPTAAILAVRTLDCQDKPAAGVTLTLSAPSVAFSFLTGQALSTDPVLPTDSRAIAGFANIALTTPFVNVVVEGVAPGGTPYGKVNVTVRSGQLTLVDIRPDVGLFGL